MKKHRLCTSPDCRRPIHGRGLCNVHYYRARRRDSLPELPKAKTIRIPSEKAAWLAGFFDGEGHIGFHRKGCVNGRVQYYATVRVSNSRREAVLRFRTAFGGTIYGRPPDHIRRTKWFWEWEAHGIVAACALLTLRPYLFVKAAQADVMLKHFRRIEKFPHSRGHPLSALDMTYREGLWRRMRHLNHM